MDGMIKVKTGLGYQNYEEVIANNIFYVDKTYFIREWWENADKVTLITRPRRKVRKYGRKNNTDSFKAHFQ